MTQQRANELRFPLKTHTLVFKVYDAQNYGVDDLVINQSRQSITSKVMQSNEDLVPNKLVRDLLIGSTKATV